MANFACVLVSSSRSKQYEIYVFYSLISLSITSLEVRQEGAVRVEPVRKFEDAGLHPVMLRNVKLAGYEVPTPIQQYCFPAIKLGHDVVACAQTGKCQSFSLSQEHFLLNRALS